MNQIRYGQLSKYGPQRGNIANKLGDMNFAVFPNIWGGFGIDVTESDKIAESLILARNFVKKENKSVVVNIWVDPNEYAPGTKSQTMYK